MQINFVCNELIKIFNRIYNLRDTGGPIFEQYMRNAVMLAMDNDLGGGTLMDIPLIFEDREFRDHLKRHCRNPHVTAFWSRIAEKVSGDHSLITSARTSRAN